MNRFRYLLPGLLLLLTTACQPEQAIRTEADITVQTGTNARAAATPFAARIKKGTVQDGNLAEISGVVESRAYPGYFWVQEDSGNLNKVYLISEQGAVKATVTLPSNAQNRDWEDIAIGPGPDAGKTYIYVGDIGNNARGYDRIYVHRFVEPTITIGNGIVNKTLSNSDALRLEFAYSGGKSDIRNCETLLLDPTTKDLLFITKEDTGENKSATTTAGIYRAAYPQKTSGTNTISRSGDIDIKTATGGDISANGTEILIKNYTTVYYWKKTSASQTISQLLKTTPVQLPYTEEPGGEGIGWKANGSGYYTISEVKKGIPAAIYYYARQ